MNESDEIIQSILESNRMLRLDNEDQRREYAAYMTHRVLRSAYDTFTELGKINGPWDTFLDYCAKTPAFRAIGAEIMKSGVVHYTSVSGFNFIDAEPELEDGTEEYLKVIWLYPPEEAANLVDLFFFFAEAVYYTELLKTKTAEDYTWEAYLDNLQTKPDMWNRLSAAFRDGLTKIDYARYWKVLAKAGDI